MILLQVLNDKMAGPGVEASAVSFAPCPQRGEHLVQLHFAVLVVHVVQTVVVLVLPLLVTVALLPVLVTVLLRLF